MTRPSTSPYSSREIPRSAPPAHLESSPIKTSLCRTGSLHTYAGLFHGGAIFPVSIRCRYHVGGSTSEICQLRQPSTPLLCARRSLSSLVSFVRSVSLWPCITWRLGSMARCEAETSCLNRARSESHGIYFFCFSFRYFTQLSSARGDESC